MSPIDHEKLKQTRAGNRGAFGWRPKDGSNIIRILPPGSRYIDAWEELENLALKFKIHYFKLEGQPTEVSRCLVDLGNDRCPACAAWRVHKKADDPALAEMGKGLAPSDQYLFNILDIANLDAGIQPWTANWTCWNQIMEVAANPAWGNVVDPADGVEFDVKFTPKEKSRKHHNEYQCYPQPDRTSVMEILEAIEGWQEKLDALAEHMAAPKSEDDILRLLDLMGFPSVGTPAARRAESAAPAPRAASPRPAAAAPRPAAAAPHPTAAPRPSARPAAARPSARPAAAAARAKPAPAAAAEAYDPGPDYEPVLPDEERPEGAPRCFGDYDPKVRPCARCAFMSDCQFKVLDIGEEE